MQAFSRVRGPLLIGNGSNLVRRVGVHMPRIEQLFHRCVLAQSSPKCSYEARFVVVAFKISLFFSHFLPLTQDRKPIFRIIQFPLH